ncbi:MAG: mucoidy inhibitor MuiA family protein [Alphaproteobacteria bacterium]
MKRMALMALTGFAAAISPAVAADIFVEAPIQAVTVYPQSATITREGSLVLPVGTNVIVLDNIPIGIDTSSIRVSGVGGATTQIQSVSVRRGEEDNDGDPARDRLVEEIESLRDDLQALNNERAALSAQRQFIYNLIEAGPAGFAELLGGQGAGIDQWQDAWDMIGEGIYRVEASLRDLDLVQRGIEEEIEALLNELSRLPTAPAHLEILIEAAAATATDVLLEVSYRVSDAGWTPAYDVSLSTGTEDDEPRVTLVRRAEIYQNTGEDWTEIQLTLSTTRPSGGTEAPTVGEALIGVFDNGRFGAAAPLAAGLAAETEAADAARVDDDRFVVQEQQAIADFGDFRADYVIPVPTSLESGAGSRSVRIATDEANARLFVEVAPRFAEEAYLTASFTIESEAPVLAGLANLFRDDAYVGRARIAFANPGEKISLGFGVDDQVRATWTLVDRNAGERGLLTRIEFDEREYRATIENNHSREIDITVVDRVPVADDDRISVNRLPEMTEPTEEDVDGRRGIVAWTYTYAPGETRDITNAYVMSWPADLPVFGAQ